jgi:hypothetical protein
MKIFLLLLLGAVASFAQQPSTAPRPAARLDARTGATRKKTTTSWQISPNDYNKSFEREVTIDVIVSSVNRSAFSGQLEWYVVGKPVATGGKRMVITQGLKPLVVDPANPLKTQIDSGPIKSTDGRLGSIHERSTSGSRIEGWFLRLTGPDGSELANASSQPELASWGAANCHPK